MVADLQLYEGRSLDVVTQAESLGSYGAEITQDYAAYTAANAMVEAADKLTEAEGSLQQYLLLVGALRSLATRRARREPHPRLLPAARARPRRLGAELPGLRALRQAPASTRPSSCSSAAWSATSAPRPAPRASPRSTVALLGALLAGDWTLRRDVEHVRPQPGERHRRRLHPVAPRARAALAAARLQRNDHHVSPKPYTHRDAVPYRPARLDRPLPARTSRRARCPSTSPSSWTATAAGRTAAASRASRGTRPARRRCSTSSPGAIQAGVKHLSVYAFSTENWKRSPEEVRFLMGYNRDVLHRRRDQLNEWGVRIRWAGRRPRLWASVINELQFAEQLTAGNDTLTLTMCVNYGGRNEITDAVRSIADDVACRSAEALGGHRRSSSRSGSTCPSCPTSTCSCAARGSSAPRTSCSGSRPTPRWCSSTRSGPTSRAPTCGRRSTAYARRNRRFGGAIDAPSA